MITLPAVIIEELHKLNRDSSTLALMEIPEHSIYLARNTEDITWNGNTYTAFWFEFEAIESSSSGSVPELELQASNVTGNLEKEIIAHDNFSDSSCVISFVNSKHLSETTPIAQVTFQIVKPVLYGVVAGLSLSVKNPLLLAWPSWHYHGSICQYRKFKGALCGYSGDSAECNRTLQACIDRANQKRFGAQPGLSDDYAELDE
jgi:phage-related protein